MLRVSITDGRQGYRKCIRGEGVLQEKRRSFVMTTG